MQKMGENFKDIVQKNFTFQSAIDKIRLIYDRTGKIPKKPE